MPPTFLFLTFQAHGLAGTVIGAEACVNLALFQDFGLMGPMVMVGCTYWPGCWVVGERESEGRRAGGKVIWGDTRRNEEPVGGC